jgi:sec-independent protein translocase protein TatC
MDLQANAGEQRMVKIPDEKPMTMMDHLSELAKRLKVILIALAFTSSIGFLPDDLQGYTDPLHQYRPLASLMMQRMKHDFLPSAATLIASGLVDTLFVYMYITVLIGIVLASPVIAYELYAYVKPALYPNERKYILWFTGSFVGLFVLGLGMAYFLVIPITFQILVWFIKSGGALPLIGIKDFYTWILTLLLASGIFYTIPVFVVLLVQFGIIPARLLSGKGKLAVYLGLWMFIWIFGPDPTPFTATVIMVPFAAIFEVAAFAARRIEKSRRSEFELFADKPVHTKCRWCGELMEPQVAFCPSCGKSQV